MSHQMTSTTGALGAFCSSVLTWSRRGRSTACTVSSRVGSGSGTAGGCGTVGRGRGGGIGVGGVGGVGAEGSGGVWAHALVATTITTHKAATGINRRRMGFSIGLHGLVLKN